jgi:cobalt/nickel transport system permease protein
VHHVVLERWSRGGSFLHARDARAKTLALLGFLVLVAIPRGNFEPLAVVYFLILLAGAAAARLPLYAVLRRAAVVLPFCAAFAVISLLAGEPARALLLVEKSYLSALAVLLVVGTTPMPQLLRGLESLRVPRFLLMVAQFLYRYLFVISEQAQHMRMAGLSRGGLASRQTRFRAAAGALTVLFSRSFERAGRIHRSMLSRGFDGRIPVLAATRFRALDAAFLVSSVGVCALIRSAL